MAELFTDEWFQNYQRAWNAEPELAEALEKIGFNSTIGYGFDDEDEPRGLIRVEQGRVVAAGTYHGEPLSWDLRASPDNWRRWMDKPPGMMALGVAYTSRKLKFRSGDYAAMVKDPRMAGPFIRSFAVMGQA